MAQVQSVSIAFADGTVEVVDTPSVIASFETWHHEQRMHAICKKKDEDITKEELIEVVKWIASGDPQFQTESAS